MVKAPPGVWQLAGCAADSVSGCRAWLNNWSLHRDLQNSEICICLFRSCGDLNSFFEAPSWQYLQKYTTAGSAFFAFD